MLPVTSLLRIPQGHLHIAQVPQGEQVQITQDSEVSPPALPGPTGLLHSDPCSAHHHWAAPGDTGVRQQPPDVRFWGPSCPGCAGGCQGLFLDTVWRLLLLESCPLDCCLT